MWRGHLESCLLQPDLPECNCSFFRITYHFEISNFCSQDFVTIGTDWSATMEQFRAMLAETSNLPGSLRNHADLGWIGRFRRSVFPIEHRRLQVTNSGYNSPGKNEIMTKDKALGLCFYDKGIYISNDSDLTS
ncbi:unnamed protein product [Echinostoma caproni]|uniref:VASt domain-containing protein n=1 Tax=Echinostoma caproni TaxID=27848 RepID=A0A183BGC8_9TREM|nr:unnamed protein product [Echinostoma caproni]